MENIHIKAIVPEKAISEHTILLPASKSISNRALILNALSKAPGQIFNLAECDDTDVLSAALTSHDETNFNIGAAGTAMRFLTAYLAGKPGDWTITGSERMKQRPIGILVDALNNIGAEISYLEKEGFPPLKIHGKKLLGGTVRLNGGVSSQFISALLMIAPTTQKGIELHLEGEIISRPYIEMTLQMMKAYGVDSQWEGKSIQIVSQEYKTTDYTVESDWSAASYWYEIAALSPSTINFTLPHLYEKSLQGDSMGRKIFEPLGVSTQFVQDGVRISKTKKAVEHFEYDFSGQPDIAQTLVVTCCSLGITFRFTGLQTLKIKETDRIEALKNECKKLGFILKEEGVGTLYWDGEQYRRDEHPQIATYKDHRMAMAFAPSTIRLGDITIEEPNVVSKSYPKFWDDLWSCQLFENL